MASQQGYIEFFLTCSSKPCNIWFNIIGKWPPANRPIVVIHGGPGYTHDYMLSMSDLIHEPYNRTLVMFDQLGSGKSTSLPTNILRLQYCPKDFFLMQILAVLDNLGIWDDFDMVGHSWGGMLACWFAAAYPEGLHRLVIANTPVSGESWIAAHTESRQRLPELYRRIASGSESTDSTIALDYIKAMAFLIQSHTIRFVPLPPEIVKTFEAVDDDHISTMIKIGTQGFGYNDSMRSWSIIDEIHHIKLPTLVLNGLHEGTDVDSLISWLPLFRNGSATYEAFPDSTHMPHWEERKRFMKVVGSFLAK